MSEILAPAGDKKSVLAAINAGADAIYLGLKEFSARSSAENFDMDGFSETVKYAHVFGVKIYVAMNTLVKERETESFLSAVSDAWNAGADAIIISDIFLGGYIKKSCPQIVMHLSTQAGVCNVYGALFAKEMGFSRVILARETPLEDIRSIAQVIETEVFVQGALCSCFSGQCYLSSFAGGNSGNRGKCKQPCRKLYTIDMEGYGDESYKLSLSDLSVGEDIEKLIEAGVFSFKIEGRMRRPEYVAAAVKYYRGIIDGKSGKTDLSDLKRTYNRGNYTKGLAFGQDKSFLSPSVQGHIGEFVGVVKVENGKFICVGGRGFSAGDGFKILRGGKEVGGAEYSSAVKDGFILSCKTRLKNGDKVFVTTDCKLNNRLLSEKRAVKINISGVFNCGSSASVTVNGRIYESTFTLEKAENKPLTQADFNACFSKTDKYPFEVAFGSFISDGVFVPASALNAFRREVFAAVYSEITQNRNEKCVFNGVLPEIKTENNSKTAAIAQNLDGLTADIGIYKPADYSEIRTDFDFSGEKFLYLPPFITLKEIENLKSLIVRFDGIYCDGVYAFKLAEELKVKHFAGTGMNISNRIGVSGCKADYFALSKELTLGEIKPLCTGNAFYLGAGDIKVMDLIYCPFGKKCASCDKRGCYTLKDESGREFTLRRYSVVGCRFEVYNCASLAADCGGAGVLVDGTFSDAPENIVKICRNGDKLREYFKNYTRGHSVQPVN